MGRRNWGHHVLVAGSLLAFTGGAATSVLAQAGAVVTEIAAPDGTTALHEAVRRNDLKAVDALIRRGADVKAATRYGVTAMSLAATNGNAAILRRLIEAGADPNTATPGGETALMTAARTGSIDAVRLLVERGANVNARTADRAQTALMWAVTENHSEIVRLLVASGADVKARTTVTVPKGEYVPARAGGASGNGIVRQRALADGRRRDDAAALRRARRQCRDDAAPAGARRRHQPVIGQSHVAAPHRAPERTGRARDASSSKEAPNPNAADDYHRGPLFAAIELRNFNHDKYPFLFSDGRDPLPICQDAAREEGGPQPQDRHDAGPRPDAVRRLVGQLRRADAVHSRGALGRHRRDAPPAAARRRSQHRHGARDRRR